MDDEKIVGLFLQRDERAISETTLKYGKLCGKIAYGILGIDEMKARIRSWSQDN